MEKVDAVPVSTEKAPSSVVGSDLIGARLKAARRAQRKSLMDVARASGLTKSFLSRLERDQVRASVASLIRLCDVLEISVGSLFEADTGNLVRNGEYSPINFGGQGLREFILTPRGEHRLQAILSDIEPGGGGGKEPYSLPTEVEFAFVLAGALEVTVEGRRYELNEGDALTFPSNTQHSFSNPSESRTQVLWVFAPALQSSTVGGGGGADGSSDRDGA